MRKQLRHRSSKTSGQKNWTKNRRDEKPRRREARKTRSRKMLTILTNHSRPWQLLAIIAKMSSWRTDPGLQPQMLLRMLELLLPYRLARTNSGAYVGWCGPTAAEGSAKSCRLPTDIYSLLFAHIRASSPSPHHATPRPLCV